MSQSPYDLVVIGAGPGGYVAAIRAAQLGMRVACIEKDHSLGGTCLNVGCIPSKALLESSELFAEASGGLAAHGIRVGGVELDLDKMMKRKGRVVTALTKGVAGLFKKNGVDHLIGKAHLAGPGKVELEGKDSQTLEAKRILIATGSAPIELPGVPFDGDRIVSSTEALCFENVPENMLVVGAGAIGLELGSVWARLGSKVSVVELADQIVPGADRELAELLERSLHKQGLRFRLQTSAQSAETRKSGVRVSIKGPDTESHEDYDVVLVAVGRKAYTDGLGLDTVGITTDERGRIPVDSDYRTSAEGIHAIGDVIAGPMLAHKAEEEGVAAVEKMAGVPGHVNYDAVASIVYTFPELASVGMSEDGARSAGHEVKVGKFPFIANGRARCAGHTEGMIKIVADATTDRVLGVHVLGASASELIAEAAVAVEFSATAEDLARSVHAHPTLSEAMKEAALAVDGRQIHM